MDCLILGICLGLIGSAVGLGFLAYRLCRRSDNAGVERFMSGIAHALGFQRGCTPEPPALDAEVEEVEEAGEVHDGPHQGVECSFLPNAPWDESFSNLPK